MGKWTHFHPAVFILTFCTYALYHVVRKTISYVKSSVIEEWTPPVSSAKHNDVDWSSGRDDMFEDKKSAEAFIGLLNATFLFVYAAGLYFSGMLADRLNLRLFLTVGMVMSSLTIFVLGPVLEWTHTHSKAAYLILMVSNGLCQSTGWPCVVAAMANWFGKGSRGLVMGLWSASPSVGSMLGALMCAAVVDYGYEYTFLLTSSSLLAGSVVIFFGLVTSPRDVGLPMPDEEYEDGSEKTELICQQVTHYKRKRRRASTLLHSQDCVAFDLDLLSQKVENTEFNLFEREPLRRKSFPHSLYGSTWNSEDGNTAFPDCSTFSRSYNEATVASSSIHFFTHGAGTRWRETVLLANHKPVPNRVAGTVDVHPTSIYTDNVLSHSMDGRANKVKKCKYHNQKRVEDRPSDGDVHKAQHRLQSSYKCNGGIENAGIGNDFAAGDTREVTDVSKVVREKLDKATQRQFEAHTADAEKYLGNKTNTPSDSRPRAISFFRALLLPGVIPYALAHACIKMVNYVFFFWLPFYLVSSNGWTLSTADKLSICYDVGGVTGGTIAGVVSNCLRKQALVVAPMLLLGVPALYLYSSLPAAATSLVVNGALLAVLGSLIGGVANIIAAAIVADLGRQPAIRGSVEALSTVAGIVEGTGTLGAALGQLAVPYLNVTFGWPSVFYLMMAAIVLTVVSVVPIIVAEVKEVISNRRCGSR